jgi:hypothetical protein
MAIAVAIIHRRLILRSFVTSVSIHSSKKLASNLDLAGLTAAPLRLNPDGLGLVPL